MMSVATRLLHIGSITLLLTTSSCSRQRSSYQPVYPGAHRVDVSTVEFDDGDTFDWDGETIRVLGIDTPEIAHPEAGQHEGQPFGDVAADSTHAWMISADLVEIVRDGKGRYGRRLAHVFIDGELLSVLLIQHALAYETVTFYGDNGFPDLAQQIMVAARESPKPEFEEPYKWKRRQREKK